jgi:hypothetical protein
MGDKILTEEQVTVILSARKKTKRLHGIGLIINNFITYNAPIVRMSELVRSINKDDIPELQQAALLNRLIYDPRVSVEVFSYFCPIIDFYSRTFFNKNDEIKYDGYNKDYLFDVNSNHRKIFEMFRYEQYFTKIEFTTQFILETKNVQGVKKIAKNLKHVTWENLIRDLIISQQFLKVGILMIRKEARLRDVIQSENIGKILRAVDDAYDSTIEDNIEIWPIVDFDDRSPPDPRYKVMLERTDDTEGYNKYKIDIVRCRFCFENDTFTVNYQGYEVRSARIHYLTGEARYVMQKIFINYLVKRRNKAIETYRLGNGKIDLQDFCFFTSDPEKVNSFTISDFLTLVNE